MPRKPRERRVRSLRDGGTGDSAHAATGALAGGNRADPGRARARVRDHVPGLDQGAGGSRGAAAEFICSVRQLYPGSAAHVVEVRDAAASADTPALITELASSVPRAHELAAEVTQHLESRHV